MATTNDIKNGSVLSLDGQLWSVIEFQHVKPGKGGAFVRTKIRNVRSGKVVDKTFNAGTKIDFATVDRRDYSYLYQDGDNYVFMDTTDYDQVSVPAATVGDASNYMLEGQAVQIAMHDGEALSVELPASVVLEVTYTEPGLQGDRSSAGTKPATLETGLRNPGPTVPGEQHQSEGRHAKRRVSRPRQRVSTRHKGRKRALDILYAADLRAQGLGEVLDAEAARIERNPDQRPAFEFARELIHAVVEHSERVDASIRAASTDWPLERMPIVDRSVLRLGTAELIAMPETPVAVVVSEAASLAGEYSTQESRGFVQGVLGAIAERLNNPPATGHQ